VAIESDLTEFLDVFEAVELFRVTGAVPDTFLDRTGIVACEAGFFGSITGVSVATLEALPLFPRPGKGK
jgi:hypothetical protein